MLGHWIVEDVGNCAARWKVRERQRKEVMLWICARDGLVARLTMEVEVEAEKYVRRCEILCDDFGSAVRSMKEEKLQMNVRCGSLSSIPLELFRIRRN